MYLEMVEVCFWHDEWRNTVLKELFPDSFLIVEEKDVFVHSCLDFSEDGRGPFSESQVHCCNQ